MQTKQAVQEAAKNAPASSKLTFSLLTLKLVFESRVWATSVSIFVFLYRPLCSRLRPDVCDRQTSDRQTSDAHHRLMPTPLWGRGHNKFRSMR